MPNKKDYTYLETFIMQKKCKKNKILENITTELQIAKKQGFLCMRK